MSETATMTLTEFLSARLDEDEAAAKAATPAAWVAVGTEFYQDEMIRGYVDAWDAATVVAGSEDSIAGADAMHIARHDPARVLAEVGAKRRIVEMLSGDLHEKWDDGHEAGKMAAPILATLAAVYADHPDYDPTWAPTEQERP